MLISSMLNVQPPKTTERFKPYSTLNARDRRLEKLLYNTTRTPGVSQKLDSLLRPKLSNQFMTMGDKLAKLERLISEFPDQSYPTNPTRPSPSPASLTFTTNSGSLPRPKPFFEPSSGASSGIAQPMGYQSRILQQIYSLNPPLFNRSGSVNSDFGVSIASTAAPDTPLLPPRRDRSLSFSHQQVFKRPTIEAGREAKTALNIPINKVEEAQPSSSKSSTLAAPLPPTPHQQSCLPPTSIAPTKDEAKGTTTVENGSSTPAPSLQKQWRDQKYKDEKDMRQKQIRLLQLEKQDREKARHNRELDEEEHRRIRLRLEGLVLERKVPPREEFPELPACARPIIHSFWNRSASHDEKIVNGFGADIMRKDMLTLSGVEWLNDEVINFFLNLIVERNQQDENLPKVYTFNTFFYQKLCQVGFAGVKRWTRKVDIFAHQLLLVPIHLGNHWCMATVDFDRRRIDYYDSLLGNNEQCLQALSDYLVQESLDKKKQPLALDDWTMVCRKDIPHQRNLCDCGMFACLFAEYASRRAPPTFEQKHIPYFRERMAWEIYQKKLLG